jgi:hypothetical protein
MALIIRELPCGLCGNPLGSAPLFSTWGVFLPPEDPLWEFCDAGLHWACYAVWPHRQRFAKAYVDFWVEHETTNPYWGRAYLDELALVTVNPHPPVEQVNIRLYETGNGPRVPLGEWATWLVEAEAYEYEHPVEREAVVAVLPRLRAALPSPESVVAAVDWSAKRRMVEEEQATREQARQEQLRTVAAHNRECARLELRRKHHGLTCRNCGRHSQGFRYMDVAPERKSYFICTACGHSMGPDG